MVNVDRRPGLAFFQAAIASALIAFLTSINVAVGNEPLNGYVYAANTTFPILNNALRPTPPLSAFANTSLDFTYTWWVNVHHDSLTYSDVAFMLLVREPTDSTVHVRAPGVQFQTNRLVKAYCQTSSTLPNYWTTMTSVQPLAIDTWVFMAVSISSGPLRNLTLSFSLPSGDLFQQSLAMTYDVYLKPGTQQVWGIANGAFVQFLGAFRDLRFWPAFLSTLALNELRASTTPPTSSPSPGTVGGTAFDGYAINLQCPQGSVITSIPFASYGTPMGLFPDFSIGVQHSSNSTAIVQGQCFGSATCQVQAASSVFGDPFPGNLKRLSASAVCTNKSAFAEPLNGYIYTTGVMYPFMGQVLSPTPSLTPIAQSALGFTYTMWVYVDPVSRMQQARGSIMVVEAPAGDAVSVRAPCLQFQPPSSLYACAAAVDGSLSSITSSQTISLGAWVFVAVSVSSGSGLTLTYSLSKGTLFQQVTPMSSAISLSPSTQKVWLSARPSNPTSVFMGAVADIRFWSSVQSTTALRQLMLDTTPVKQAIGPDVIGGTVFDGYTLMLRCSKAENVTVISAITFASYGLPSGMFPTFALGAYHAINSSAIVSAACLKKASCNVTATPTLFGDPFPGQMKHLSVLAVCSVPGMSLSTSVLRPKLRRISSTTTNVIRSGRLHPLPTSLRKQSGLPGVKLVASSSHPAPGMASPVTSSKTSVGTMRTSLGRAPPSKNYIPVSGTGPPLLTINPSKAASLRSNSSLWTPSNETIVLIAATLFVVLVLALCTCIAYFTMRYRDITAPGPDLGLSTRAVPLDGCISNPVSNLPFIEQPFMTIMRFSQLTKRQAPPFTSPATVDQRSGMFRRGEADVQGATTYAISTDSDSTITDTTA